MAKKLKNLQITKVDLVTEGANPDAHVKMFKQKKEPVSKEAESFSDKLKENAMWDVFDQIWQFTNALNNSLIDILRDEEAENKAELMNKSLDEFYGAVGLAIESWSKGNLSEYRIVSESGNDDEVSKILKGLIAKSITGELTEDVAAQLAEALEGFGKSKTDNEGGNEEMKFDDIDTSKLTPEEVQQLESLAKKAGTKESEPTPPPQGNEPALGEPVEKGKLEGAEFELPPEMAKEFEELKKFRADAEDRELTAIAKKYEILGQKPEELVPLLKSLKAAGGNAYDTMIASLDSSYEAVQKSAAFEEVGKSGHGSADGSAWAEAETKAVELMKSKSNMTKAQALDAVLASDPALAERCEKED